jgi:hypothetical protein
VDRSRSSQQSRFLPITLDYIEDPIFWVDRLWSRETIQRLIDTARARGSPHVVHPHVRSKLVSFQEPLINAGCCKRLIDAVKILPSSEVAGHDIPMQQQQQPQMQQQPQQ